MQQLSLFDDITPSDNKNTEVAPTTLKKVVIEEPINDAITIAETVAEELNGDSVLLKETGIEEQNPIAVTEPVIEEESFEMGNTVKIKIPKDKESEFYLYLKYYYPFVMNKTGKIARIQPALSGRTICDVDFHGTVLPIATEELIRIYE